MPTIKHLSVSLAVLALFAAPLSHATNTPATPAPDDTQGAPAASAFSNADANADGGISLTEFKALGGADDVFKGADANADGKIDTGEFGKANAAQ